MTNQVLKLVIFNLLFASIILPLYLTCRVAVEWLWLYVPILSFWTFVHFSEANKLQED